jgi:predicted O-linked N-acetylglucosamine transferase (SPINDLY family)
MRAIQYRITDGKCDLWIARRIPKVSPRVAGLWGRVLAATPEARLLVLCGAGEANGSVRRMIENAGVEPERVRLAPGRPRRESGVPVVTLQTSEARGRARASVLLAIGLPELIASSPEQYVRIASGLAVDRPRAGLRERVERSPVRDEAGVARKLEAAQRATWRRCGRRE